MAISTDIIRELGLVPHPEGGYYRETWRDTATGGRGSGTAIYYLLERGQRSWWHRVDASEIWHHYDGSDLELATFDGHEVKTVVLGKDVLAGRVPQYVVRPGVWQAARPLGEYTLAGCTVSPAFEFAGFELAPPDFAPGK